MYEKELLYYGGGWARGDEYSYIPTHL